MTGRTEGRSDDGATRTAVVLCADAGYLVPLSVAIQSLATSQTRSLEINVLTDGIGAAHRAGVERLAGPHRLRWFEPGAGDLPSDRLPAHLPAAALLRLLAPDLLGDQTDRLLYLDADVVVTGDLAPLFDVDLGDTVLGAVQDAWIDVWGAPNGPPCAELGMAPGTPYFNSGVLVIDTERWRSASVRDACLELLSHHDLPYADQCALNVALRSSWTRLHPRWNVQTAYGSSATYDVDPARLAEIDDAIDRPMVVHFTGRKPWEAGDVVRGRYWRTQATAAGIVVPGDDPARSPAAVDGPRRATIERARRATRRAAKAALRRTGFEIRRRGSAPRAGALDHGTIEQVRRGTRARVIGGPFAGVRLAEHGTWGGDHDLVPKVLGTYELELHPVIDEIVRASPELVVNLGCADGYYVLGFADRLPDSRVIGVDIVEPSLRAARAAAERNGVSDRVELFDSIDALVASNALDQGDGQVAWIVDVEGAEEELVAPEWVARLMGAVAVVECHDFARPGVTGQLWEAYRATHDIEVVRQSGRDPNAIPLLRNLPEGQRWLAVSEERPRPMHWLVLRPRAGS